MIVTVFRSRLRPGVREEYVALVEKIAAIAKTMPGYISHKGFFADDGERVTVAEFESERALRVWSDHPDHVEALRKARAGVCLEFRIQVCSVQRGSAFPTRVSLGALG